MADGIDVYAAGSQLAGTMCWVCQKRLMAGDEVVFCPNDKLPTHAECWEHNGGCPVYGCEASPGYGQVAVQALGTQTGEADYQCPKCRKMVKPHFLQCTYCGAPFAVENVVGSLEYEDYLFRAKDDARAQKPLWGLLVAAATGILAPLVLALLVAMQLKGGIFGVRLHHLFRDSRFLYLGCWIAATLNTLIFLTIVVLQL